MKTALALKTQAGPFERYRDIKPISVLFDGLEWRLASGRKVGILRRPHDSELMRAASMMHAYLRRGADRRGRYDDLNKSRGDVIN